LPEADFFTIAQAAHYVSRSVTALYQLCHRRRIAYSRPAGGKVYFRRADLDAFMASGRVASNDELAAQADAVLNSRPK
jgi:excisionase family DNA binding protein